MKKKITALCKTNSKRECKKVFWSMAVRRSNGTKALTGKLAVWVASERSE
jgi:hypothetical protein